MRAFLDIRLQLRVHHRTIGFGTTAGGPSTVNASTVSAPPLLTAGGAVCRRRLCGALLAVALLAAVGCAAPKYMKRQIDKGQAAISRGIGDVVDGVDRAFGEPTITDREQIVRAKIGAAVSERENYESALSMPVSLRAPLPALQRRANIFLEANSVADSLRSARSAADAFNDNKSFTAALITQITDAVHTGVRLNGFWDEGPQLAVRPFARWQWQRDPIRVLVEQEVSERTSEGVGEKTVIQFNRVLGETSFVRLHTSMEANKGEPGPSFEHAVIYRRLFPGYELVFSAQLGARHNSYVGDSGTRTPGAENDTDEGYLQFQATGKVYRPWLEYEVTPVAYVPWNHGDALEFAITFELRFVYERFLRGPEGGPPAAVPSSQPDF